MQSVPLVAGAANAPVFVMDDVDIRGGTVGRDLVNCADEGRVAAEMAVRILRGERPEDIPMIQSRESYMFDWNALQSWAVKETDLPRRGCAESAARAVALVQALCPGWSRGASGAEPESLH
jgi:ABC-type uncharacterized transport system substrate-binding protein